jgi:hypothetical protein
MGHDKDNLAEVERLRQARIERERNTPVPDSQSEPTQIPGPDSNADIVPEGIEAPTQTPTAQQTGDPIG